mmetsp:Transcript_3572/g.6926  ORF Transcript_3572/g.6926 Transcript_3572/m.6926 type:complete len:274 (+) Transcript_3572:3364-4185(+)
MLQLATKQMLEKPPQGTQVPLGKGLRVFGKDGVTAVGKEFLQIHLKNNFSPRSLEDLTVEQRMQALESLMFLTEKRNGDIKGCMCADGRKQRGFLGKTETASPTVISDSVLLTSAIDAAERRDVAVLDLPGAYLFADMDEVVHMVLRGELAELMVQTAPEVYRKYVAYGRNGEAVLYVTLQKALYGCLKSALLFYRKLVGDMKEIGFELNPYDQCVANKVIRGRQITICWHVDDLKISHWDPVVVTGIVEWFKSIYGNVRRTRGTIMITWGWI